MTNRFRSSGTGATLAALALMLSVNVRAQTNDEPSSAPSAPGPIADAPPTENTPGNDKPIDPALPSEALPSEALPSDGSTLAPGAGTGASGAVPLAIDPATAPHPTPAAGAPLPSPAAPRVVPAVMAPVGVVPALAPLSPAEASAPPPAPPWAGASMVDRDPAPVISSGTPASDEQTGVWVRAQGGFVRRSLSFTQDVYHRLRTLHTNLAVYRLDAAVYPSFYASALRGRLGFIASYEGKLTGSVHDSNFGADYPLSHSELFGGVRVRHALLQHELGFEVTAGRLHSGLDDPPSTSGIPGVSYGEVRSAVDFTAHFGRIRGTAAAGFRVPLGYGQIGAADWFPRVGGYGLEAVLKGNYGLTPRISIDASASLRRYVLEMNSEPEDPGGGRAEVAGGAVDAYFGGYVGMSFAL